MPDARSCCFHPLLSIEELFGERIAFDALVSSAQDRLAAFTGPIDAIIGFWDFPVSAMLPLLRAQYGLSPASVNDVAICEHKYWSRTIQQTVIDEYPHFGLVDPFHDSEPPSGLRFPMWVKPVKSFSSLLAFQVSDRDEFRSALVKIRAGIDWVAEPFDAFLARIDLPPHIAGVGGRLCLAEEAATGHQVTVEGYRYRGEIVVYGVVDSLRYEHCSSFRRYQYPSSLPDSVCSRLAGITRLVVEAIGLERMTFNIEYFWDSATDAIVLLEINPRHSQSHATLFEDVDGVANHQVALRLALDTDPQFPSGAGPYAVAGKCFVRSFSDGVVRRIPGRKEIDAVEETVPGVSVDVVVRAGDRLSGLRGQDSYSYELARVYIGAADEAELTVKFEQVEAALPFEIEAIP
ncbi:ATP-grasp domain-containing protein [Rhodococcus chondri]|uniref:ATP-grasp domain-containing protein n=1 Tax=Rhodococcus chondri TaxID=3065941 RepID=A0ABU7JUI0_9NOCA|nr:ATP-grasp domain-containing protein [Rhodococcus sp. CC-R104]MEE2033678.1 ATP-grasp domain-containing protein [Rhodococcus sp. CC-R104]